MAAASHLFEVILPPLVTVGDVQGIQVLQGASVVSEGHLGDPLQDLVELLLTLSLEKSNTGGVWVKFLRHNYARLETSGFRFTNICFFIKGQWKKNRSSINSVP